MARLKCSSSDEKRLCTSTIILQELLTTSLYNLCRNFTKEMILKQQPSEHLELSLKLSSREDDCSHYIDGYCGECCSEHILINSRESYQRSSNNHFYHDFTATFHNNLHEVSGDYFYEFTFRILMRNVQTNNYHHVHLFSWSQRRTTDKISATKQPFSFDYSANTNIIVHICCDVHRFKISKGQILKESFNNNIGIMLLKTGYYSDVSLIVNKTTFQAHKIILSSKSEVFKLMFSHNMSETENGKVDIIEFDPNVVKEMLSYIYTGQTENLPTLAQEVFQIAHKYKIDDLKSECEEYFIFNVKFENVVSLLNLATLYGLRELEKRAKAFIHKYEEEMVKESTFTESICRNLNITTVVSTLKLCAKYDLKNVKLKVLEFIKINNNALKSNEEFLKLFLTHPDLMQEIYIHLA